MRKGQRSKLKQIIGARVRHAPLDYGPHARDIEHLVVVDEHKGPKKTALCGLKPKHDWVLMPISSGKCQQCLRKAERAC